MDKGLGAAVLSKSGARAGKISLPFSAERPTMNTGMPASSLLSLSARTVMLRFKTVSSKVRVKDEVSPKPSEDHYLKESATLKGAAFCSCLSPVRTFMSKVRYDCFRNVYSRNSVRAGRTVVDPTWLGGPLRPREYTVSFGVWVGYGFVTQWRSGVCELDHGYLRR